MSNQGKQMKAYDFRHTCSLCMEPYLGRHPKILPCFHTFCVPCLTALAEKGIDKTRAGHADTDRQDDEDEQKPGTGPKDNSRRQVSPERKKKKKKKQKLVTTEPDNLNTTTNNDETVNEKCDEKLHDEETVNVEATYRFLCPTCRSPTVIPEGGVSALQTNFYLECDEGEQLPCEMCDENEGELPEASFICDKCCQRMCRSCRRLHDKFTDAREHHVRAVNVYDVSAVKPQVKKTCPAHCDQELCFHCQECDVSICLHCKLTSHEGHPTEDMATAAVRAKKEMTSLLTKAHTQIRSLEACVGRLERDEHEIERQKGELTQHVQSRYDVAIAWLTRARDEFMESLVAKEQMARNDVSAEKTSARTILDTLTGLVARASCIPKHGTDTVLMKNELQAALLSNETVERFAELGNRKEQLTYFTCHSDHSALDRGMAQAYVGTLVDGKDSAADSSSVLTIQDLAATFTKLKDDMDRMKREKLEEVKVFFHARMDMKGDFAAAEQILIFNNALTNEGKGYSPSTGIFTAPVTGTYIFLVTVGPWRTKDTVGVKLLLEKRELSTTSSSTSGSAHAIVKVEKGKRVWVVTKDATSFTCLHAITSFSGALL